MLAGLFFGRLLVLFVQKAMFQPSTCKVLNFLPLIASSSPPAHARSDHRGTPDFPGRTVTLEYYPGAITVGISVIVGIRAGTEMCSDDSTEKKNYAGSEALPTSIEEITHIIS